MRRLSANRKETTNVVVRPTACMGPGIRYETQRSAFLQINSDRFRPSPWTLLQFRGSMITFSYGYELQTGGRDEDKYKVDAGGQPERSAACQEARRKLSFAPGTFRHQRDLAGLGEKVGKARARGYGDWGVSIPFFFFAAGATGSPDFRHSARPSAVLTLPARRTLHSYRPVASPAMRASATLARLAGGSYG